MKKKIRYILMGACVVLSSACSDFLDLTPRNKIPGETVLSDPNGVAAFVANLYYHAPIEDFVYFPRAGFNARGNTGFLALSHYSMEAVHSEWAHWNLYGDNAWTHGYTQNRNVNILIESIPVLDISDMEKDVLLGEALFLRAYIYFALAKRFGGVPLITENQEYTSDFESLRVPRSTEKETWDLILETCDQAIDLLPESRSSTEESKRRATKWAAYALKSRAALHAASVTKYWQNAPLSGEAVSLGLVGGMTASDANRYYEACISASDAIMSSGQFSLYQSAPANPQEAANNYHAMFANPNIANNEVIFLKGYGEVGHNLSHDLDVWNNPNQTTSGFAHGGRTNPILELIDQYESYDNPGGDAPIITTTDGNVGGTAGFNPATDYRRFDSPGEIFANKDARFFASIIYPGANWKNQQIVIQGGIVTPEGILIDSRGSYTLDGVVYHTYGDQLANQYSGFDGSPNMTRTGFLMRKFLNQNNNFNQFLQSTTDFMDMRYAEVLLNYAEAVVESNYTQNNAQTTALNAINAIRFRAGHTVEIPLTLANVLRERNVELAFENKNYWDLIRRRTFHEYYDNTVNTALIPMIDLRGDTPQYIYVRKEIPGLNVRTFRDRDYYRAIPGINSNGAIQNPQH